MQMSAERSRKRRRGSPNDNRFPERDLMEEQLFAGCALLRTATNERKRKESVIETYMETDGVLGEKAEREKERGKEKECSAIRST